MTDYRIGVKVRNNRILKAIEAQGGLFGGKWCAANGLSYAMMVRLVALKESPYKESNRELTKTASGLCDVLFMSPDELWSEQQTFALEKNFTELEMSEAQVAALINKADNEFNYLSAPEAFLAQKNMAEGIIKSLTFLTKREQQVIQMRYYDGNTFREVGKELGVCGNRAMQIEAKALRRIRKRAFKLPIGDYREEYK